MSRLDREAFVAAVVSMTYKSPKESIHPEEAVAGAWFDLATAPESSALDLVAGPGATYEEVETNRVILKGTPSTACVPSKVSLWSLSPGGQFLFVGPISLGNLLAAVPKAKSQDAAARRLIGDILKGFARRGRTTPGAIWLCPWSSLCVLTVLEADAKSRVIYFGSLCNGGLLFMFKLDVEGATTAQLVELYVNRIMQVTSKSWKLAFKKGSLLDSVPVDGGWKIFQGGITANLGPNVRVLVKDRYAVAVVDDFYHHDFFASSYQEVLDRLYGEVARFMIRHLTTDENKDRFRSIVGSLPADLVALIVDMADKDVAATHEERARHVARLEAFSKVVARAENVLELLKIEHGSRE